MISKDAYKAPPSVSIVVSTVFKLSKVGKDSHFDMQNIVFECFGWLFVYQRWEYQFYICSACSYMFISWI